MIETLVQGAQFIFRTQLVDEPVNAPFLTQERQCLSCMINLTLELMSNLQVMQRVRYVSLALAPSCYTTIYNLVWKAHWSKGKCLFLINRYYMLIAVL
ncbi:hypothetical protein A0H81_02040 [Grifola frondosa]|uniref:DUF6533 domain-containing protein n=1 Tax=Grifola frondosa TaxID=5627 RepID=A0A1C7MK34_GRIFR|nr:hypothetical protein A0H81_02040 [Grifola frondosa]